MIARGQPIAYSDLQALATLANAKLSPTTPYSFNAFAGINQIALPQQISAVATYGTGTPFALSAGEKTTLWLFGYKTISGVKTYTWFPAAKAFYPANNGMAYQLVWTWNAVIGPTAHDGFIAACPQPSNFTVTGWEIFWKDIGAATTVSIDGNFVGWNTDDSVGIPYRNPDLPCGHGQWLKVLNAIHHDFFTNLDLFGGHTYTFDRSTQCLSGPWCVSVAPKCYLQINNTPIYNNLQFWYSPIDSSIGNLLSAEADMSFAVGSTNGANSFDWNVNVIINGTITFNVDSPTVPSDWTITVSDPGITYVVSGTTIVFTFVNIQYSTGTPIVLTCTRNSTPSITGGSINAIVTGDKQTLTQADTTAIHFFGTGAKIVTLDSAPPAITMSWIGGSQSQAVHWRAYCQGVFIAKTLPTLGLMPYLDVDLPNYDPKNDIPIEPASSRRALLDPSNPVHVPLVDNRGVLWPVFRDTDFVPDFLLGKPASGSKPWRALGTKFVQTFSKTEGIPSSPLQLAPQVESGFVFGHDDELRLLALDPNVTVYFRFGAPPTFSTFDTTFPGGAWRIITNSDPFWQDGGQWFVGFYNNTGNPISTTFYANDVETQHEPQGTFFPTTQDPGVTPLVPALEGESYHFDDLTQPFTNQRPIPLYGYCIYQVTVRRMPVNGVAPSAGTSDLDVNLGLQSDWGFDLVGNFEVLQTVTIPAGQPSVSVNVFWPVLSGNFLAYSCTEQVNVRAQVNFQPMVQSGFQANDINNSPVNLYCGTPFYNASYALFFPDGGAVTSLGVLLPVSVDIPNDLTALLNLLP